VVARREVLVKRLAVAADRDAALDSVHLGCRRAEPVGRLESARRRSLADLQLLQLAADQIEPPLQLLGRSTIERPGQRGLQLGHTALQLLDPRILRALLRLRRAGEAAREPGPARAGQREQQDRTALPACEPHRTPPRLSTPPRTARAGL